jgi:alkylhydroperoxidase family enzyme
MATTYRSDYSETVCIPLPKDDELTADSRQMMEKALPIHIARMFAGTDDMFAGVVGLIGAVFRATGIEAKSHLLLTLRCAKLLHCPYGWQVNAQMARNAGCTPTEIDAVASEGPIPSGLSPDNLLLCTGTDELTRTGTLTDGTLAKMQARFGNTICRKLILMIAWANLLLRFMNGCRVPLETEDKFGSRTSPLL